MNEIYYIGKYIDKKWAKSIKQLGNQVKPLTKNIYIQNVLPNIKDYYITEKADGLRCFLMITHKSIKYITSEKVTYLDGTFNSEYIFDCEQINGKICIFDVIVYNNENISKLSFEQRYKKLCEFQDILISKKLTDTITVKQFYKLDITNYQNTIMKLYNLFKTGKEYAIDGIIFVEISASYNNTLNLKWKPAEFLTIDFLAIKTNIKNQYILTVGIKSSLIYQFNIKLNEEYKNLMKALTIDIGENYKPIPFYNSLAPNIYTYMHTDNTDLHEHIIELSRLGDKWQFHRIRNDRDVELKTGSYYGNNYKVAETTLASILNPLSIKDLVAPYSTLVNDIYFKKQDDTYKSVKHFNNYVKNLLIQKNSHEMIMDLASGRGGDITKYINAGVKDMLLLEIDTNAIEELINRKYTILDKKNSDKSCNLTILNMDLNNDYKKNIAKIDSNAPNNYIDNIIGVKTKVIFCHFAMHYLLESEKSAQNIISFISHYLESMGLFIVTIFDGKKVFDLLKNNKGKWNITKKYMIEYIGKQPSIFSGFGHKINVLLPLSDKPYEEPLIDLYALDKLFKKNNIFRIEEKNFVDILAEYSSYPNNKNSYANLSDNDKEFIGLYKYVIYRKN
jgi:hypothetical protein